MKATGSAGRERFIPNPGIPSGAPVADSGAYVHMGSRTDIEPCAEHVIQVADERTLIATRYDSL